MRPTTSPILPRLFGIAGCACVLTAAPSGAQTLADPVLPKGAARLDGGAVFQDWRERFTIDGDREDLGSDLTRASAAELVPGLDRLEAEFTRMLGSGLPLRLGPSSGLISYTDVRVPLALDVGVLDRVTVGVTVPLVQSTVEADLRVSGDDQADLGINPGIAARESVETYLSNLWTRFSEANAAAAAVCGQSPGSAECAAATGLVSDLEVLVPGLFSAYSASALFPAVGTTAGDALLDRMAEIDVALQDQGLSAVGGTPPLAASVAGRPELQALFADFAGPFVGSELASNAGRWGLGDVEARVSVRLIDGAQRDSVGSATSAWSLAATGTVRLPTGAADSVGLFLDRGFDDGQLDVEGSLYGAFSTRRFAVRARASYLLQQPGRYDARVVPLGEIISGVGDIREVERDPGDGLRFEVEPGIRLSPTLSLGLSWRWTSLGASTVEATTTRELVEPTDPPTFGGVNTVYYGDAALLAEGTEFELQELGGQITYRTVDLPENDGRGFEAFLRLRTALSGSGGRVPAGVRGEFGLRFVRSLWGR
jgi:hypothetical protein